MSRRAHRSDFSTVRFTSRRSAIGFAAFSAAAACLLHSPRASAVGEASTKFELYVPPNDTTNSRYAMLIVTAVSEGNDGFTTVNIVDDGGDGDTDDSVIGVKLKRGQSRVVYIKDGAVNDDYNGKWDGDLFEIDSDAPVIVQMATRSDWQHDWLPADNKTMVGNRFYLWAADTGYSNRDLDIFPQGQAATVKISRISSSQTLSSASSVVDANNPIPILTTTIAADCDLMFCNGLGVDLMQPGHTYMIESTTPVSVMTGSLANLTKTSNARDGGGFVPSITGGGTGKRFTFGIPHDPGMSREQELRVVSFGAGSALLEGFDLSAKTWSPITTFDFAGVLTHGDVVGTKYELFRLTSSGPDLAVFEGNWLETGSTVTSDTASFVPALGGKSTGLEFLAYVPPPGDQNAIPSIRGTYSHITAYAQQPNTTIQIVDDATSGSILTKTVVASPKAPADVLVPVSTWEAMNKPSSGIRPYTHVLADKPIALLVGDFNDNWQTFAPAMLPAAPTLTLDGPTGGTIDCTTPITLTTTIANPLSETITGTKISTTVPSALTIDHADEVSKPTLSAPVVSTGTATTTVKYAADDLLPGATRAVSVTVRLSCASSTAGNGALLGVSSLASGAGAITPSTFSTQQSSALVVADPGHTTLEAPTGLAYDGARISGSFVADREVAVTKLEVLRSTSPTSAPAATGITVAPLGDQSTGRTYTFADSSVTLNADYYYAIKATMTDGSTTTTAVSHVTAKDLTPPPVPSLTATPGADGISLALTESTIPDFAGYRIERAEADGNYTTLVAGPVNVSSYKDTSALPWIPYQYRAYAINTSSTMSGACTPAKATIIPSGTVVSNMVMFEDRLGPGANDWDFNDFIAAVDTVEGYTGTGLSSIDLSIEALARGARYQHAFRYAIATAGAWNATVSIFSDSTASHLISVNAYSGSGTVDLPIFADTAIALPPNPGETMTNTVPGEAHVAGQLARVHITLSSPSLNGPSTKPAVPYGPYLRLLKPALGDITSVATGPTEEIVDLVGPLQGVPIAMALIIPSSTRRWANETVPMWVAFPGFADFAVKSGGDPLPFYQAGLPLLTQSY